MRKTFANLSTTTSEGFTPAWPCTLLIYEGAAGGFRSTAAPGLPARVSLEVERSDGEFQRFPGFDFNDKTCVPVDLPGCKIRIVAENLTDVTVEVIDSAGA